MNTLELSSGSGVETCFDVKDEMIYGMNNGKKVDMISAVHPLMHGLVSHSKKQDEMSNLMLRKTQGLHAPLRLVMEKNALKEVGHMPFLHRHNALMDALTGRDMDMEFEDFLNNKAEQEKMMAPHIMLEKHLKNLKSFFKNL
nr:EOG090X0J8E [Leptodora kindtii]